MWRPSFMLVFPPHHPDETLRSLASPSSLQGPELHGWRPPVDCVRANELCAAESNCSSRYRTLRQCLAGRDRNTMLANKECQAALEVLQESPLYDCRCKRGMKRELQCLQTYWSIHLGLTEGKPAGVWWGAYRGAEGRLGAAVSWPALPPLPENLEHRGRCHRLRRAAVGDGQERRGEERKGAGHS